jgi:hypothetical protein
MSRRHPLRPARYWRPHIARLSTWRLLSKGSSAGLAGRLVRGSSARVSSSCARLWQRGTVTGTGRAIEAGRATELLLVWAAGPRVAILAGRTLGTRRGSIAILPGSTRSALGRCFNRSGSCNCCGPRWASLWWIVAARLRRSFRAVHAGLAGGRRCSPSPTVVSDRARFALREASGRCIGSWSAVRRDATLAVLSRQAEMACGGISR